MSKKISPIAQGIIEGFKEVVAYTEGKATPDIKETIIYTADVRSIREKLEMSQSEFANAYKIPLATLQNWEQGRRSPDATASAYLWTIGRYPEEIKSVHQE